MKRAIKILLATAWLCAFFAQAQNAAPELTRVLTLIDQNKPAEAARAFAALKTPDAPSPAMAEFVRGRLAITKKKYPEALQHFSNVVVFHSRNPKWMPAATFYEGVVYKKTGYLTAASNIVEELKLAYPDTEWSRRAGELKK